MIKRTITGAAIAVFVYTLVYFSYITPLIYVATAALCVSAVYEIYRAADVNKSKSTLVVLLVLTCGVALLPIPCYEYFVIAVLILSVGVFTVLMVRVDVCKFTCVWQVITVAFITVLLFKAIPVLRVRANGDCYLAVVITVCFSTDVFAFLIGKAFGKHKLAPHVSPNKTVEGAVGGIAGSVLVAVVLLLLLENNTFISIDRGVFILYVILTSVFGQVGDLSMSSLKRIVGVKDYGRLLPGHGGILDRFDSLLFAVAFTVAFCTLSGGFIF